MGTVYTSPDVKLLTPEELSLLTRFVGARPLLGVDDDPVVGLGLEQGALAILHAERSLRARGFARLTDADELAIDEELLAMVVTCGYATKAIWVTRHSSDGNRFDAVAYCRDEAFVLHSRPKRPLHQFQQFADRARLLSELLFLSDCSELTKVDRTAFTIPADVLAAIGQKADPVQSQPSTTESYTADAIAFSEDILNIDARSSFVILLPQPDESIQTQELTVLQGPGFAWLLSSSDPDAVKICPIDTIELSALLNDAIATKSTAAGSGRTTL